MYLREFAKSDDGDFVQVKTVVPENFPRISVKSFFPIKTDSQA